MCSLFQRISVNSPLQHVFFSRNAFVCTARYSPSVLNRGLRKVLSHPNSKSMAAGSETMLCFSLGPSAQRLPLTVYQKLMRRWMFQSEMPHKTWSNHVGQTMQCNHVSHCIAERYVKELFQVPPQGEAKEQTISIQNRLMLPTNCMHCYARGRRDRF